MNVLPQISQIFTDVLEKTKICVNLRNMWEITFQAGYECSPADSTDIHRCSWVTKICVNPRNLWEIFCMHTMQTVGATASYIQKRL